MKKPPDDPPADAVPPPGQPTLAFVPGDPQATAAARPDEGSPGAVGIGPGMLNLSGYEVEGELGRGGMGVVYRASQHGLHRPVAIKVMLAAAHAKADEIIRFLAEAETAAQLQHQGIVQIYDTGRADGMPYFAMEFIDGGSLADRLTAGPAPAAEAARVALRLAEAVGYAHAAGVIHRDLKPSNILLTADGTPKITDFGLAKRLAAGDGLTRTGSVLGTPAYMPPEQARGDLKAVGPIGDVYSLGAILYELLTGHPPFRSTSPVNTLSLVLNQLPKQPRAWNPLVPRDLETICLKCLAKEPAKRYPSAEALADDLRRYLDGRAIRARRVGVAEKLARWARRNPAVAGLLGVVFGLLLLVAVGAVTAAVRINDARREADRNAEDYRQERDAADRARADAVTATVEKQRQLIRSHVGTGLRFLDTGDSESALLWYARAWREDEPQPERETGHRLRLGLTADYRMALVGLAVETQPIFAACASSTGERVLTLTQAGTAAIWNPLVGRRLLTLPCDSPVTAIALTADGRTAVTGSTDGTVRIWDTTSGTATHTLAHGAAVECVALAPTGTRVATAGGPVGLKLWDRATGRPVPSPDAPGAYFATFTTDGAKLATADETGHARAWEVASGKPLTPALAHGRRTAFEKEWNLRPGPVFTPDGTRLLTIDWAGGKPAKAFALTLWDLADGKAVWGPVTTPGGYQNSFSPDGKQLLGAGVISAMFDAERGRVLATFPTPRECIQAALVNPNTVATASTGGTLWRWGLRAGQAPTRSRLTGHAADSVRIMTPLGDSRRILVAGADGTARIYDAMPDLSVESYSFDCGRAHRFSLAEPDRSIRVFSPDGRTECRYGADLPARLGPRGADPLPVALATDRPVAVAKFSADGRVLVTWDRVAVRAWNATTGEARGPAVPCAAEGNCTLDVSPDGRRVVAGWFNARGLRVLGVTSGEPPLAIPFDVPPNAPNAEDERPGIARWFPFGVFSPDGRRVACHDGYYAGVVEVWDVEARVRVSRFRPQRGWINGNITFSADGAQILISSSDTTVQLWTAATGTPAGPPLRHASFCRSGQLSPDGRLAVTCDASGVVALWDPSTGMLYGRLPVTATRAYFGSDGRRVIVRPATTVRQYGVRPLAVASDQVEPLIVLLTGKRIDPATDGIEFVPADTLRKDPNRYLSAWRAWRELPSD